MKANALPREEIATSLQQRSARKAFVFLPQSDVFAEGPPQLGNSRVLTDERG